MKKLRNFFAFAVLSTFTFAINYFPKVANASICECQSYECYWNVANSDCQPFYWQHLCAVVCP